jgi:hypothetical protein
VNDVELARVLIEAGEVELALDWAEGEGRIAYHDACLVLAHPASSEQERRWATEVRDQLAVMFVALRALDEAGRRTT